MLDASAIRLLKMLFGKSATTRQNKKNQHDVYARVLVRGCGGYLLGAGASRSRRLRVADGDKR